MVFDFSLYAAIEYISHIGAIDIIMPSCVTRSEQIHHNFRSELTDLLK